MLALAHGATIFSGPAHSVEAQAALACERRDDAALRRLGEQTQRAIETRLAAAVRARDHVQRAERHDEIAQRAVVGDGECRDHRCDGSHN